MAKAINTMDQYKHVNGIRSLAGLFNSANIKWFICFGTLLKLIRDQKVDFEDDIDVGLVGYQPALFDMLNRVYQPLHRVVDDTNGQVIQASFRSRGPTVPDFVLDVYVWLKKGSMYWHTFDENKEFPSNGKLKEYVFKGMPAQVFEAPPEFIKKCVTDLRIGRAMNSDGTWRRLIPGHEGDGISLNAPFGQGYFLDIAYPDWPMRRPAFRPSETKWISKVRSCRDLK